MPSIPTITVPRESKNLIRDHLNSRFRRSSIETRRAEFDIFPGEERMKENSHRHEDETEGHVSSGRRDENQGPLYDEEREVEDTIRVEQHYDDLQAFGRWLKGHDKQVRTTNKRGRGGVKNRFRNDDNLEDDCPPLNYDERPVDSVDREALIDYHTDVNSDPLTDVRYPRADHYSPKGSHTRADHYAPHERPSLLDHYSPQPSWSRLGNGGRSGPDQVEPTIARGRSYKNYSDNVGSYGRGGDREEAHDNRYADRARDRSQGRADRKYKEYDYRFDRRRSRSPSRDRARGRQDRYNGATSQERSRSYRPTHSRPRSSRHSDSLRDANYGTQDAWDIKKRHRNRGNRTSGRSCGHREGDKLVKITIEQEGTKTQFSIVPDGGKVEVPLPIIKREDDEGETAENPIVLTSEADMMQF